MAFNRGQIYLANFSPTKGQEPGKVRPCVVLQSDHLNAVDHPTTVVIPLTSQVHGAEPLRVRIAARDNLKQDSDLMLDQIRTIDNKRLVGSALTSLTDEELQQVEAYLPLVLGFEGS